jgi:hypothetical protein
MGELADDASFLNETLPGRAVSQFLWEKLDGYQAANQGIVGTRHAAVSASADDFKNLVSSDLQVDLFLKKQPTLNQDQDRSADCRVK